MVDRHAKATTAMVPSCCNILRRFSEDTARCCMVTVSLKLDCQIKKAYYVLLSSALLCYNQKSPVSNEQTNTFLSYWTYIIYSVLCCSHVWAQDLYPGCNVGDQQLWPVGVSCFFFPQSNRENSQSCWQVLNVLEPESVCFSNTKTFTKGKL